MRALLLLLLISLLFLPGCGRPTPSAITAAETPTTDLIASTATATPLFSESDEARFAEKRLEMVEFTIRRRGVKDPAVLRAMEGVPRHAFVLPDYLDAAYADHPLPIGFGQTISQPYIVALMTELLHLKPGAKVLEIGTGSGYQAAVLAELVEQVYSIEIIDELAGRAAASLNRLGYDSVHTRQGDGYFGWPEEAPFDAIIVTAAPDHVPYLLIQQLTEGGRLVVPVGPPGGYQSLWQITRHGEDLDAVNIAGVRFVPMVGGGQSGAERGAPEDRFLDPPGP